MGRLPACVLGVSLGLCGALSATEFLRGDFNSDQRLSLADTHKIMSFLFRGGAPGPCLNAGDTDDSGTFNISDAMGVLNYLILDGAAPATPFPELGLDPTVNETDWMDCGSYGTGNVLDDPTARLEILDSTAPGGENGEAVITVRLTHATTIAGYSGRVLVDSGVVGYVQGGNKAQDLSGTGDRTAVRNAKVSNGKLNFGFLSTLTGAGDPWMPPRVDGDVLAITVCLKGGAPAGEYPLTLVSGELVDPVTGQFILPTLASGTLRLLEAVAPGAGCVDDATCSEAGGVPGGPLPELHARFEIQGATAVPGSLAEMPFVMRADAAIQAYSFSIDFDETILQAEGITKVFQPAPQGAGFEKLEYNNADENPGSGGVDEGFFVGAMVFSFIDNCHNMPANRDNVALKLRLRVSADTMADATEVAFLDGGRGSGQPVRNTMTCYGSLVLPEVASSFVFLNGLLGIQPDITVFLRGDANGDARVDLSDAIHTLGFLFLGEDRPDCYDAADADDSGYLGISDPILTLKALFGGAGISLPAPFPEPGEDPTADAMTCSLGP